MMPAGSSCGIDARLGCVECAFGRLDVGVLSTIAVQAL